MAQRLVLNFHGIGEVPVGVPAAEVPYWCPASRFGAILDEVVVLSSSGSLPIQLTFDDGNLSDATLALPALVARGLSATFFVCAGRIGQAGYLDVPAMRDLLAAGMAIGSHGWDHVDWRRADDRTLGRETQGALVEISTAIGRRVDEVGVPFGSYDRRVLQQLRRSGVRAVFTSDGGRAPLASWLVPRQSFVSSWTDSTVRQIVASPAGSLAQATLALRRLVKQLR